MATDTDATGKTESVGFPPFDQVDTFASQAFWFLLTFAILYLVLSRLILPRIGGTLERRSNQLATDMDEAERLKDESVAAQAALDQRLAEARAQARSSADKAKADADAMVATETQKLEAELDERLGQAEARIREVRQAAMGQVEDVATDTASAVLEHLGVSADAAQVRGAVANTVQGNA